MLIKKTIDIASSEITSEDDFHVRRRIIKSMSVLALSSALPVSALAESQTPIASAAFVAMKKNGPYSSKLEATDEKYVTSYNNYYEFSTNKTDPAKMAQQFKTTPWSVAIEGEVEKPGVYTLEDILKPHPLEERIYRFRCVEAWSMVVPWVGISLGDVIKRFQPTSKAKYVEFTTLLDPEQMPGQKSRVLDWPYVEGLRIDEAMHPLSLLAVGLYGKVLPNQNGAPLRLIVPWKYGFKSIKAIVKIRLTEQMPKNTWNISAPREYGFYANVNPAVAHPRWSQSKERVLGGGIFSSKRATEPFNGYAQQVASLYSGMDLVRHF